MDIVWHRDDLRAVDNTAVNNADTALPVYIFDPSMMEHASPRRLAVVRNNVAKLKQWYREHGSDMVIRHGDPRDSLREIAAEYDAQSVLWNKSYGNLADARDRAVVAALETAGIASQSFHDKGLHAPEEIYTNKGDPYSVFTYYHRKWEDKSHPESKGTPLTEELVDCEDTTPVPSFDELGVKKPSIQPPEAGHEAARDRLEAFVKTRVEDYDEQRDYPAAYESSRMSVYFSYGMIGAREAWEVTETAAKTDGLDSFREQLAWRDFYTQVLYHHPEVVTENFKSYENEIQWSRNQQHLDAWKQGTTGYPIVDAGMRQLQQEGYMHNRLRMIVASFLTKDLLIDWREGYHWFRDRLFDHDTANNNGGWQWAASTGTDAQPYFRIFNPMTQGERYDPDAAYITQYVDELESVPADKIHSWTELSDDQRSALAPTYPNPIVEHGEQREKALDMFKAARGESED